MLPRSRRSQTRTTKIKLSRTVLPIGGLVLVIIGAAIVLSVGYFKSHQRTVPLVYSNNAMLYELWNTYKATDLEPSSDRTIDHSQTGNITTSEGESYTLLRAVWMDDQTTFDKSLAFSQAYMQRPDSLFSWKYGQLSGTSYGVSMTNGDYNAASDGDTDIALALLMAYSRWDDPTYLKDAQPIISGIWNEEVVTVAGQPVLTADNLEQASLTNVVVNPSYFNPAAYKIFAKIDPLHNWTGLASNSYAVIDELSQNKLGASSSDGLPPDWIEMNRTTGALTANASANLDTNYGYNAFRTPFYLALDYEWFHDPRDAQTLHNFSYLNQQWQQNKSLEAVYGHNGSVVGDYQAPAMYGASIGYFMVEDPAAAKSLYQNKLVTLYSPDQQSWKTTMSYYDDNWAWFGLALSQGALPNLTTHT